jgi:hypothetical protein
MSSGVNERVPDTASWVKGCFTLKVGTTFETYKAMLEYSESDESFGGNITKPALDPAAKTILNEFSKADMSVSPVPIYYSRKKCRDTSLGGNDAINPLPQFGYDDDISFPMYNAYVGGNVAMGQVYSEVYDDNQQILYLNMGTPAFNDMGAFWGTAADMKVVDFVNKGSGITAEKIGYLVGSAPLRLWKIATIPKQLIAMMMNTLEYVPITKYYAFESQMPMYFRFVNHILVMLAVNLGFMATDPESNTTGSTTTNTSAIDIEKNGSKGTDLQGLGYIFTDRGLDIAKIITKRFMFEHGYQHQVGKRNTDEALFAKHKPDDGSGTSAAPTSDPTTGATTTENSSSTARTWKSGWVNAFFAAYGATFYDGHLFIGFRVDKIGSVTESFSNSTGESKIAELANAKFAEANAASYSMMQGNVGDGILASAVEGVYSAAAGLIKGATETLKLDMLGAAATGASKIDIPEVWTSSTFSRSQSFHVTLMSPYGDIESIYQSELVPLACALAAALPRGTGESSHSAPFICQAYCRGVFSSPACIIESLEVSRGADQFGYNFMRLPLEMSLSFTIKDLSPTMSLNLGGDTGFGEQIFGSDDAFQEYMCTLSAMSLRARLAPFKQLARKATIFWTSLRRNKLSPYLMGMDRGTDLPARVISSFFSGGKGLQNN